MVHYYSTTSSLTALPDAEKVFVQLRELNIRIGLNTGFSKEISDIIIDRLGWLKNGMIDSIITSSEVPAGRPFPYMIEQLMLRSGVKSSKNVIKIGDTKVDILEGKNAGCLYTIGITTGAFTQEELEVYSPSFIINRLGELVPLIETQQANAHIQFAAQ
jgi:phosphonatase-like hydrolase